MFPPETARRFVKVDAPVSKAMLPPASLPVTPSPSEDVTKDTVGMPDASTVSTVMLFVPVVRIVNELDAEIPVTKDVSKVTGLS